MVPSRCSIPEVMRSIGDVNRHDGQPSIFLANNKENRCAYSASSSVFFYVNFIAVDTIQQRRYRVFYTADGMRVKECNLADFWVRSFKTARSAGHPAQLHFNFRELLGRYHFRAQSHPYALFALRIERFSWRTGNRFQNRLIGFQVFNVSFAFVCNGNIFWSFLCQSQAPVKVLRTIWNSFARHSLFGSGKYSAIAWESGSGDPGAFGLRCPVRSWL